MGKLLGNRILAAVKAVRDNETILVFSGGQGPDEKVSEARAMQRYAVEVLGFRLSGQCLKINQEQLTKTWFFLLN
ncbi:hypothetical protein KF146HA_02670 [Lactococcus lactis]|nr:hypothetical protein [Lactococcus lactis]